MSVKGLTFNSFKTVDHSVICIVVSLFATLLINICYIYWASKVCSQSGLSCLVSQLHQWNYCTRVSAKKVYEAPSHSVLWSRDCFKILPFVVMQRVARVCQRQLSYLLNMLVSVMSWKSHGRLYQAAGTRVRETNQTLQIWFLFWEERNHLYQSTSTPICRQLQKLLIRSRSNIAGRVLRMRCTDIRIQAKSAHDQNL